jgi:hypothetical protein
MRRCASALTASAAVLVALAVLGPATATASTIGTYNPKATAASTARAPAASTTSAATPAAASSSSTSTSTSNGDVLAANGLRSPFCALFTSGQTGENCAASGVPYSPAPDGNLAFDVHIDSGGGAIFDSSDAISSMIDNLLNFGWQIAVAITHLLFFLLEWAFSLNLINSSAFPAAHLTGEIRQITLPFMAIATAVFGAWMAWIGLVHRRHGEAVKSALHALLLCVVALVVLYNPIATVGDLVGASQQFGMLVIGSAAGQPGNAQASFESGLEAMYTGLIEKPAGLLEFGNVNWATEPNQLSHSLRATALTLARSNNNSGELHAVQDAHNNLELFTAFPANGSERNAINQTQPMSLLRALCGTDDATKCKGSTASEAEFRTSGSVGERVVASALITPVLLVMWLLLGWIALMLLASSVLALFYLLLMGYMALVVFTGHGGRQRFHGYLHSFGGTIIAAALFAALLGLVMDTWRVLMALNGVGFVLQWLLVLVLLAVVFVRRHTIWGVVRSKPQDLGHRTMKRWAKRVAYYQVGNYAQAKLRSHWKNRGKGQANTGDVDRTRRPPPRLPRPDDTGGPRPDPTRPGPDPIPVPLPPFRTKRRPEAPGTPTATPTTPAGGIPERSRELRERQERSLLLGAFHSAQSSASRATAPDGELRQAADRLPAREEALAEATTALAAAQTPRERERLRRRQESLARRVGDSQQAATQIETSTLGAAAAKRAHFDQGGTPRRAAQGEFRDEDFARARGWLDRQAGLERGAKPPGAQREQRDYPRLAAIVGQTPVAYQRAQAPEQLRMRANIDRELDRRVGLAPHAGRRRSAQPVPPSRPAPARQGSPSQPGRSPQEPRRPTGGARDAFAQEVRRSTPRRSPGTPPPRRPPPPPARPPRR